MKIYDNILVEHARVARLIMNQPEKRNALSKSMMKDIIDGLNDLNSDPQVVVIVISGKGKGFCAGADLSTMSQQPSIIDSIVDKTFVKDMLLTLSNIDKIVISQVHGFALAGGFGLATTCDLSVVSNDCKLGMPEIKRGIVPMNIMNPLSRIMPKKLLLELMLTGENISPEKAMQLHLINQVVPAESLEEETLKLANNIAQYSASAIKLCKNAFYQMQSMDYVAAFSYLTGMLTVNTLTGDAKEGTKAFLEKRKPKWKDN